MGEKKKYRVPRGFRDFPPDLMILRKKIIGVVEEIFVRYGFDPLETPALEYWETLKGKYGEDVENKLVYKFQDPWSKEWLALRYDLTVPLARFVASHMLPMPFKRYHISRVWRHESPQKGRYREFWQCDVDIIGSPYPEADAEIVNIIIDVMLAFNFSRFAVRISDRRLLTGIFEEELGLRDYGKERMLAIFRAIDKLDKIGIEGVKRELEKLEVEEKHIDKILEIISISGSPSDILAEVNSRFGGNPNVKAAVEHLGSMLDFISNKKFVQLDLSLVRGLDYYTGPIFETYVAEPRIGSLTGGGRYDDLIRRYGGPDLPATGTTIGIERIIDAGLELGIFNLEQKTYTRLYVICMDSKHYDYCWSVTQRFREHGVPTQIDLMRRKHRKQREYADKKNVPYLLYIGNKEVSSRTFTLYDRKSQKRYEGLTFEDLLGILGV